MPINDPLVLKSVQDIVDQITIGNVIPVLGYDLLLDGVVDDNPDHFLKRLIKIHAGSELQVLDPENKLSGNDLINAYFHNLPNKGVFKKQLSNTIQEQRFNLNLAPDSFRKLVDITYFKLFVNATFTNSLELALNTHRAIGNNREEIGKSYKICQYHTTEPIDLPKHAPPGSKFNMNDMEPSIYNLFGIHDDKGYGYVLTDADYIELIYDLIMNRNGNFTNILSYLKEGNLLFLGCSFPDWFFRFLIRVISFDRLDLTPIREKSVIDSLNDASRSVFISQYKIHTLDINCNELVAEIYKKLQNEPGTPGLSGDSENNCVFISYCRADEKVAGDITSQFDEKYIDYFLDTKNLRTGSYLDQEISAAIDKSSLFIPIISDNIKTSTPYVWKEWDYAIVRKKEIIPVYKNFVPRDTLFPKEFNVTAEIKDKILNYNFEIGIIPEGENNRLSEKALKYIKNKQYLSRVSGNKQ